MRHSTRAARTHLACAITYELGLVLAAALLLLALLHRATVWHTNVATVVDTNHVTVTHPNAASLTLGEVVPIYRFSNDWRSEIGTARIERVEGQTVLLVYDPASMRWPMGRQGLVTAQVGEFVQVGLGSGVGLRAGDHLNLFDDRKRVGRVVLTYVGEQTSTARMVDGKGLAAIGLLASEFTVATQAVFDNDPWLNAIEVASFALALGTYGAVWIRTRRSPFLLLGERVEPWLRRLQTPLVRSALQSVWWQRLEFSGGIYKRVKPGAFRSALIWLLHGVIALAFAHTLLGFVQGNLKIALDTGWRSTAALLAGQLASNPSSQFFDVMTAIIGAVGHMLTHRPHFDSVEALHVTVRYLLWTLTIFGCLIGYGHSIFGFLWGKRIRNLDFTFTGWITNAVCYGPLLGVVFWQMLPPLVGPDPIFAAGAIGYLAMGAETFLNLLYMLTIWNLGTLFGVMTDKGVRSSGFYAVVRHPSYTMEVLMFLALELRGLSGPAQWFAATMLLAIYWLRSEREDAFMYRSNPQYAAYRLATPYKFVPGIY